MPKEMFISKSAIEVSNPNDFDGKPNDKSNSSKFLAFSVLLQQMTTLECDLSSRISRRDCTFSLLLVEV